MFGKLLTSIAFLLPHLLAAQADSIPAQLYTKANNIRALVNANGLLFYDKEKGGQFLTDSIGRSPIKAAGLWLGGFDPGGNLKVAAQLYNEDGKRDFVPGIIFDSIGNWNQIWRTTYADIYAHINDYYDNYNVDTLLPSIFGWPAYGNKFFKSYYGFDLPDNSKLLADFYDRNGNGQYDPDEGDFPFFLSRGCDGSSTPLIFPDEIIWYSFHDLTEHTQSNSLQIRMNISHTIFSFGCTNDVNLNNTVFSRYKLVNAASEDIDSCFAGLFLDFELGCPEDDYIGVIPESNIVYAYNSDDVDEDCFDNKGYGEYPPIVAVKLIRGPLNVFRLELPLFAVMPLFKDPPGPGMGLPSDAPGFYNYLTGSWLDGTPLTSGGNGYDQASTNYAKFIYPGDPRDEESWNELSEVNMPGARKVIASYGPFKLQPGAVNEILVSFTFLPNGRYPLFQHLVDLYDGVDFTMSGFDNCTVGCVSSNPPLDLNPNPDTFDDPFIFIPNPAHDKVRVKYIDIDFATSLEIYDAMCRLVYKSDTSTSYHYIDVSTWPQGVYYAIARKGPEMYFSPLVVAR